MAADSMAELEDIYLPYRPKRRTRATIAREKGLEALAELIYAQGPFDPASEALRFVDPDKGVKSAEDALAGARDIIAEKINEDSRVRSTTRKLFLEKGQVRSKVIAGKESTRAQSSGITSTAARIYRQRPDIDCWPCSGEKKKA